MLQGLQTLQRSVLAKRQRTSWSLGMEETATPVRRHFLVRVHRREVRGNSDDGQYWAEWSAFNCYGHYNREILGLAEDWAKKSSLGNRAPALRPHNCAQKEAPELARARLLRLAEFIHFRLRRRSFRLRTAATTTTAAHSLRSVLLNGFSSSGRRADILPVDAKCNLNSLQSSREGA